MKALHIFGRVLFVGLLACGLLTGCAQTHESTAAPTSPVAGNPNGSWQLYVNDSTNGASGGSTNSWQLSIHDQTNNPSR
jgi:hypothetical protein